MKATVTVYNGGERLQITGPIVKQYANGLTVQDERGVVWYATSDRAAIHEQAKGYLF